MDLDARSRYMWTVAGKFSYAANLIGKDTSVNPHLVIPCTVNSAFSIEVLLKLLILLEKGEKVDGHLHSKLFKRLNGKTRARLSKEFIPLFISDKTYKIAKKLVEEQGGTYPTNLLEVLKANERAFVDNRYAYEGKMSGLIAAPSVREVLKREITRQASDKGIDINKPV